MAVNDTPTKDEGTRHTFVEACCQYVRDKFGKHGRLIDACDDDKAIVELSPGTPESRLLRYKVTFNENTGGVLFKSPRFCHAQPKLLQADGEAEKMSLEQANTPVDIGVDDLDELKKSLGTNAQPDLSLFYGKLEDAIRENTLWDRTNVEHRRLAAKIAKRRNPDLKITSDGIEVCILTCSADPIHVEAAQVAVDGRFSMAEWNERERVFDTVAETRPDLMPLYGEEMKLCERAGCRERYEAFKAIAKEHGVDLAKHFDDIKATFYERNPSKVPTIERARTVEEAMDALLHCRDGSLHFCIEEDRHVAAQRVMSLRPDLLRQFYGIDDPQVDENHDDQVKLAERAKIADESAASERLIAKARERVRSLGGDPSSYAAVSDAMSAVVLEHPDLMVESYRPGEKHAA